MKTSKLIRYAVKHHLTKYNNSYPDTPPEKNRWPLPSEY